MVQVTSIVRGMRSGDKVTKANLKNSCKNLKICILSQILNILEPHIKQILKFDFVLNEN